MFHLHVFSIFLFITHVFGGVLILSPKEIAISSLKPFNEDIYNLLKDTFKKAKIVSFKINSEKIPIECEHLLQAKYTSYLPTINYIPENIINLNDQSDNENCNSIKKQIHVLDLDHQKNVIYLIIHNSIKVKRNVEEISKISSSTSTTSATPTSTTNAPLTSTATEEIPTTKSIPEKVVVSKERVNYSPDQPVLYYAEGKALMYSVRAPVLKQNDTIFELGPTSVVKVDDRDSYLRMICIIPVESGKITLRFRFPKENGYWYLTSVEVEVPDFKAYNLTITEEVSAPMKFSYRCGGETVFTDSTGSASLTLYDMQVQPQTNVRRFSDAYNCVPFMTGPIWSGIFVSSILAIGLIVGLGALGSIKTMDKFDNSKTKQLTITVIGE